MSSPELNITANNRFTLRLRAFTSVLMALTCLALVASGVVLFIAPAGRTANWGDWRALGLTKRDWIELHIWFSVIFLLAAGLHLFFNFRPLLNYFKNRLTRRIGFRPEWLLAVCVCAGVLAGTRAGVPPFSTLLNFQAQLKRGREAPRGEQTRGWGGGRGAGGKAGAPAATPASVEAEPRGRGAGGGWGWRGGRRSDFFPTKTKHHSATPTSTNFSSPIAESGSGRKLPRCLVGGWEDSQFGAFSQRDGRLRQAFSLGC